MAGKAQRTGRITGHGTGGHYTAEGAYVTLYGEITDDADPGRPVAFKMTPEEAHKWAAGLIRMAEHIEATQGTSEAEQAPEPAKLTGGLANLLGVADKAPVEFTEERPGVWRTATPEGGERLDDAIDAALANLGTSLADLRAKTEHTGEPMQLPDEQGRYCSRCHQDHTPEECYYRV